MNSWEADVTETEHEYHHARARKELQHAQSASSICARRAHLKLASLHAERIESEAVYLHLHHA
jgi:hypothetical protein